MGAKHRNTGNCIGRQQYAKNHAQDAGKNCISLLKCFLRGRKTKPVCRVQTGFRSAKRLPRSGARALTCAEFFAGAENPAAHSVLLYTAATQDISLFVQNKIFYPSRHATFAAGKLELKPVRFVQVSYDAGKSCRYAMF